MLSISQMLSGSAQMYGELRLAFGDNDRIIRACVRNITENPDDPAYRADFEANFPGRQYEDAVV